MAQCMGAEEGAKHRLHLTLLGGCAAHACARCAPLGAHPGCPDSALLPCTPSRRSINEGRNADRFRRNFREEGWVKVPRVFWQYRCAAGWPSLFSWCFLGAGDPCCAGAPRCAACLACAGLGSRGRACSACSRLPSLPPLVSDRHCLQCLPARGLPERSSPSVLTLEYMPGGRGLGGCLIAGAAGGRHRAPLTPRPARARLGAPTPAPALTRLFLNFHPPIQPGVKITNTAGIAAAGLDAPRVAQRATEAYLIQILRHGFFHAGGCGCAALHCAALHGCHQAAACERQQREGLLSSGGRGCSPLHPPPCLPAPLICCRPAPRQHCHRWQWIAHLLRLWNDGGRCAVLRCAGSSSASCRLRLSGLQGHGCSIVHGRAASGLRACAAVRQDAHTAGRPSWPPAHLLAHLFSRQGEIVPATRERLLDLYYGIVKKDTDAVSAAGLPVCIMHQPTCGPPAMSLPQQPASPFLHVFLPCPAPAALLRPPTRSPCAPCPAGGAPAGGAGHRGAHLRPAVHQALHKLLHPGKGEGGVAGPGWQGLHRHCTAGVGCAGRLVCWAPAGRAVVLRRAWPRVHTAAWCPQVCCRTSTARRRSRRRCRPLGRTCSPLRWTSPSASPPPSPLCCARLPPLRWGGGGCFLQGSCLGWVLLCFLGVQGAGRRSSPLC